MYKKGEYKDRNPNWHITDAVLSGRAGNEICLVVMTLIPGLPFSRGKWLLCLCPYLIVYVTLTDRL